MPRILTSAAVLFLASAAFTQTSPERVTFQGIGDLPGGRSESCAIAVSADGRVVTGWSGAEAGGRAFRWEDGAIRELSGGDDVVPLVGHALSADGSVIVGLGQRATVTVGFRWEGGKATPLPVLADQKDAATEAGEIPETSSFYDAWGISADGKRAVGDLTLRGRRTALAWTELGTVELPPLRAGDSCFPAAISADGLRAVGHCTPGDRSTAVAWKLERIDGAGEGRVAASPPGRVGLQSAHTHSEARAISSDGGCVVGDIGTKFGVEALRVCADAQVTLGGLSREHEFLSAGRAVSADGTIVVGSSIDDRDTSQAVVWDPVNGMRPLLRILAWDCDLDLGGWRLDNATGVSADGTTIVGCGRNPKGDAEGWIVRLPKEWWRNRAVAVTARELKASEQPEQQPAAGHGAPGQSSSATPAKPVVPRLGRGLATIKSVVEPRGVAVGSDGTIYVADAGTSEIKQFSEKGDLLRIVFSREISPILGPPSGMAVSDSGALFVADAGTHRIHLIAPDGRLERSWGGRGSGLGRLNRPAAVALHGGKLNVADSGNDRIQVFEEGVAQLTFGRFGRGDGELDRPVDVAVDESGRVYVADLGNDRVCRFEPDGRWLSCWGERGSSPGLFNRPTGIEYNDGRVYVVDQANHRVQVFTPEGRLLHIWGRQSLRPREGHGRLNFPASLAIAPDQTQAVLCEPLEGRCQIFGMIDEVRGGFAPSALSDAAAYSTGARAIHIAGGMLLAIDDTAGHVLVYRLTDGDPVLITKVGTHGYGAGQLSDPRAVWYDAASGTLFIADTGNRRMQIFDMPAINDSTRGYSPNLARLRRTLTLPDNATASSSGRGTDFRPVAVALSPHGLLAVTTEIGDQVVLFDRDFKPVLTLAGGDDEDATLRRPVGVDFSRDGEKLFVLDAMRRCVVVFDASGNYIRTFGGEEFGGDAVGATGGIHAGMDGFVYVSDRAAHRVLKFDEEGGLIAKWGSQGIGRGQFFAPDSIALDAEGQIYVNDHGNRRVQMFASDGKFLRAFGSPMSVRPTLDD